MSRLINADKFEAFTYQHINDDFDNGVQFVLEKIDEAPTVCDIEQIRQEIEKQSIADFIAVSTVIDIIDRYTKGE